MSQTVFLDRDGIINKKRENYVKNVDEFILLEDAPEAIRLLKEKKFLVIVVTNQSAINRGYLSHEGLDEIHQHMKNQLQKHGSFIDAIYYCPHRPEENCRCRKPQPDLLYQAMKDFSIVKNHSWLIGDSESDIEAAKRVGIRSIKMQTDSSLLTSVNQILRSS